MNQQERIRFDELLDEVVGSLPASITVLLQEKPVVVEDHPSLELLQELGLPPRARDELCGLHSGPMLAELALEGGPMDIQVIHLFREGILQVAGGWNSAPMAGGVKGGQAAVRSEIRITLLHEIGHHFGLDEEQLEQLGFG